MSWLTYLTFLLFFVELWSRKFYPHFFGQVWLRGVKNKVNPLDNFLIFNSSWTRSFIFFFFFFFFFFFLGGGEGGVRWMVKKMLSTFRWCHVVDDMTNALNLTLKHDYLSDQIWYTAKLHHFPRLDNKTNRLDSISSYLKHVVDCICGHFFFQEHVLHPSLVPCRGHWARP